MICGPSVLASQSIFESQHMSQEWEYSLIQWVSCEKTQGRFLLLDISTHVRHMTYLIRCWFRCLGNTTNTTFSVTRTLTHIHIDVLIHCCSKHLRHLLPEQVSRSCGMPICSMYCISTNTYPNGPSVGKYPSTMDYSWRFPTSQSICQLWSGLGGAISGGRKPCAAFHCRALLVSGMASCCVFCVFLITRHGKTEILGGFLYP